MTSPPAPPRAPAAIAAPPVARWRDVGAGLSIACFVAFLPLLAIAPNVALAVVMVGAALLGVTWLLHRMAAHLAAMEARQEALLVALHEAARNRQAEQAAAAHRSVFLDSLGSQLATSVAAARHVTETLLQSGAQGVQAHCGHALRASCENLGALVDEILDLRDLEQGKLAARPGPFDPGSVVEEALAAFADGSQASGVRLLPHVRASTPARIDADARRFRQLLLHLVHQAVRSCAGGCLVVEVEGTPTGIRLEARGAGLVIADDPRRGPPGAPSHIAGLAAALGASVVSQGGRISVDLPAKILVGPTAAAAPRAGTVIVLAEDATVAEVLADYARFFRLDPILAGSRDLAGRAVADGKIAAVICGDPGVDPITDVPWINPLDARSGLAGSGVVRRADLFEALVTTLPSSDAPASGHRVLLVDDNPVNRLVARKFVERMGYAVDEAENGLEAVEMAKPGLYAAILMDLQMPVMNGLDAAREIRRQLQGAAPPIIAVTANVQASDRQQSLASGMVEHLGKPLDQARLRATLEQWIQPLRRAG